MKYRTIRKRILQILARYGMNENDYRRLRKLFIKQFERKTPYIPRSNKQKMADAIPVIKKIIADEDTPSLFNQYNDDPTATIGNTLGFVQFLEKIAK